MSIKDKLNVTVAVVILAVIGYIIAVS